MISGRSESEIIGRVIPDMPFGLSAYGGFPVKSSIIVHPKDQMSDAVEAPFSSMTSGATVCEGDMSGHVYGGKKSCSHSNSAFRPHHF
jgi:hypothetical protein